jgi:hypothetical protein
MTGPLERPRSFLKQPLRGRLGRGKDRGAVSRPLGRHRSSCVYGYVDGDATDRLEWIK